LGLSSPSPEDTERTICNEEKIQVGFLRLVCVVPNVTGAEVNITCNQSLSMEKLQIQQKSKLISIREFSTIVRKMIGAETPHKFLSTFHHEREHAMENFDKYADNVKFIDSLESETPVCEDCRWDAPNCIEETLWCSSHFIFRIDNWTAINHDGTIIQFQYRKNGDKCLYCNQEAQMVIFKTQDPKDPRLNKLETFPEPDLNQYSLILPYDKEYQLELLTNFIVQGHKPLKNRRWKILSNGWGQDSVYELVTNWWKYDEIIFSDTGSEQPETLDFIKNMMKKLPIEALARITNLRPEDNPYGNLHEYYIAKKAMPTPMKRDCTGKFKINPIRNSLRDRYAEGTYFHMHVCINYTEAGERMIIRKDLEGLKSFLTYKDTNSPIAKAVQKQMKKFNITVEQYLEKLAKRQNVSLEEIIYRKVNEVQSGVQYMEIKYPLYDKKVHRKDEPKAIKARGYDVPTKSGCFCCPYGTKSYYMKLANNHPDLHQITIDMIEGSRMRKDVTQAKKGKLDLEELQKNNGCSCFKGTFEEYTDDDMKRTNKW